jgi:4-hydroxyphenylpyruvate dioxygenase
MPTDFATDVRAFSAAGFGAMELWLDKLEAFLAEGHSLSRAASLLSRHRLTVPAACAQGDLLLPMSVRERLSTYDALKRKLMICEAFACPTLIVPSDRRRQDQTSSAFDSVASDNFGAACDIAASYGVQLGLEFIKGDRIASTLTEARVILEGAAKPNAGLVLDTFHHYAGGGRLADIDGVDIASVIVVHVNDAPLTASAAGLSDGDRTLLGSGAFPVKETVETLVRRGYGGYFSLELFDRRLWAADPFSVARSAYANLRGFLGADHR